MVMANSAAQTALWTTGGAVGGVLFTYLAQDVLKHLSLIKSRLALRRNIILGHEALETETVYVQIPGQEKQNQIIRNDQSHRLKDIYPEEQWQAVVDYIQKAKKFCTEEEPIVFMHLDKVLPKKYREETKAQILRDWSAYFRKQVKRSGEYYVLDSKPVINEETIYPLLVYEPSAKNKRLRVFMTTPDQLKYAAALKEADVLIEGNKEQDLNDHHYSRLRSLRAVSKLYWSGALDSMLEKITVGIKRNFNPAGSTQSLQPPTA